MELKCFPLLCHIPSFAICFYRIMKKIWSLFYASKQSPDDVPVQSETGEAHSLKVEKILFQGKSKYQDVTVFQVL